MPMETFVIIYAVALVTAVVVCRQIVRRADRTDALPPLPVTPPPDPYEVAYLAGANNRVARIALLALVEHGYLRIITSSPVVSRAVAYQKTGGFLSVTATIERTGRTAIPGELPWFMYEVWTLFPASRPADRVWDYEADKLKRLYGDLEERLQRRALLPPREVESAAWGAWRIATAILGLLAQLLFGFLAMIVLTALVVAPVLGFACYPDRLSKRGNAFLSQLRRAYSPREEDWQDWGDGSVSTRGTRSGEPIVASHLGAAWGTVTRRQLTAALFGAELLGGDWQFIDKTFKPTCG